MTGTLSVVPVDGGELFLKHSGLVDAEGAKMDMSTWPLTVFFLALAGCVLSQHLLLSQPGPADAGLHLPSSS
ncbi:MAG: hypothetical protein R2751_17015 [Bacteroidales bacterium]